MTGLAAAPRNQALTVGVPADETIMDAWFNLTERGTGTILAGNLTAANARALWNLN